MARSLTLQEFEELVAGIMTTPAYPSLYEGPILTYVEFETIEGAPTTPVLPVRQRCVLFVLATAAIGLHRLCIVSASFLTNLSLFVHQSITHTCAGAISDVAPGATAFAHRSPGFDVVVNAMFNSQIAGARDAAQAWLAGLYNQYVG